MTLTLDKMNRLVVPKQLRERFALQAGDDLEVTLEADGFKLRPLHPASPLATEAREVLNVDDDGDGMF